MSDEQVKRVRRTREEKKGIVAVYDALPSREEKRQWLKDNGFTSTIMAQWRTAKERPISIKRREIRKAMKGIPNPTPEVITSITGVEPTPFDHDIKNALRRIIAKHELVVSTFKTALEVIEKVGR